MVQNSLSFCLSEKLLISLSYLNEILAGYNNLGCRLFPFIILTGLQWDGLVLFFKSSLLKYIFLKIKCTYFKYTVKEVLTNVYTCTQYQNQNKEHFHHPQKLLCVAQQAITLSMFPHLHPIQLLICFLL